MTHLLSKCLRVAACAAIASFALMAVAADLPETLPYGTDGIPSSPEIKINDTKERVVELLGTRLDDPYVPNRVQTLTEIGACQKPVGAKYVRAGLGDADVRVRAAAAAAAGQVNDPTLTADLKKPLIDTDARVRREAVLSGAAYNDGSFIDAGLADPDPSVKAAAVSVATAAQAGKLVAAMSGYPPATQIAALRSLGRIGDAKYADTAAGFLGAGVPFCIAAAESLGQMKATAHLPDVAKLLTDEHPAVRRTALLAMPTLTTPADLQAKCITALADEDYSVREAAARLLKLSPTPDAISPLVADLPVDSARLHTAVREALVAIGPPTVPAAEKLIADANARRREDGSYLLGQLKSDASLDAHIALMKDADWQVVHQAAVSLGQIGRKEAVPAVHAVAARATELPTDTQNAAEAIEQSIVACAVLGDSSILPMCKTIMPQSKTVNASYRAAGAFAIGRLGDPADASLGRMLSRPMGDLEEAGTVQVECVKAMGQLKLKAAMSFVGDTRADAKYMGDAKTDWIDYWARCRITGKTPPLEPVEIRWEAQTSISLLAE